LSPTWALWRVDSTAAEIFRDGKYVKQNFIGVKCPKCKDGELVEKPRDGKGNTF